MEPSERVQGVLPSHTPPIGPIPLRAYGKYGIGNANGRVTSTLHQGLKRNEWDLEEPGG